MKSKLKKSSIEYCKFLNANIYNHYPDILSTEKIVELIKLFPDYKANLPRLIILGNNKYDSNSSWKYFSHYEDQTDISYINKNIYLSNDPLFICYEDRYPIIAYLLYHILFTSKLTKSERDTKLDSNEVSNDASKFMNDNKEAIDKILGINIPYEMDNGIISLK